MGSLRYRNSVCSLTYLYRFTDLNLISCRLGHTSSHVLCQRLCSSTFIFSSRMTFSSRTHILSTVPMVIQRRQTLSQRLIPVQFQWDTWKFIYKSGCDLILLLRFARKEFSVIDSLYPVVVSIFLAFWCACVYIRRWCICLVLSLIYLFFYTNIYCCFFLLEVLQILMQPCFDNE